MALTDEQLKALGLDAPPPDVTMAPAPPPATILPPNGPTQHPRSILGDKIPAGARIPTGDANLSAHDEGKQEYEQYKPQITSAPGTADYFRQRQEQLDYKAQHPWGSPISPHPGALGSILHGLSVAGNIAGDIVAPGTMENIPGTQLHNAALAAGNERGIRQGTENASTDAATQHTQAETAAEPSRTAFTEAQTEHTQAETGKLNEPEPKSNFEKMSDGSIVQLSTDPHTGNTTAKLLYKGDPKVETDMATVMVKGKPHSVLVNKQSGATIKDLGETKSPQGPSGNLIVTPQGTVEQAKPGVTLTPGTQTLSGFSTLNRPTTQERNVSDQAKMASTGIPGTIKEIQDLKDELGPISGRWNEFTQGKVGMDNPRFAGLRADLLMLSSAVALAHARGRLPENLREEFDRAINAPKQTPENLIATLQHIQPWLDRASKMGEVGGETAAPAAPSRPSFADWKNSQAQ